MSKTRLSRSAQPELLQRVDRESLIDEIKRTPGEMSGDIDVNSIRIEGSDELKVLAPASAILYTTH